MKKAFIICIIIIVLLLISLVSLYFINSYYKDETKPDTTGMFGTGYWYDGQGALMKHITLKQYLNNNRTYRDLEDFIDKINKHNQEIETKLMNSYINIIAPEIVKTETIENKYGEYVEIFVLSGNEAKQSGYYTIKELSRDKENDFINVVSIELPRIISSIFNDLKNG